MITLKEIFSFTIVLSFFIHFSLFTYSLFLFFKREKLGLFILLYLVCIVPFSNFFVFAGIVAERILFLSSLWFISAYVILCFYVFSFIKKSKSISVLFIASQIIISIFFVYLTIKRNFQWKDNITLISTDIKHLKQSIAANGIYAIILYEKAENEKNKSEKIKLYNEAVKHYKISDRLATASSNLKISKQYEVAYATRAQLLYEKAENEKAENEKINLYNKAIKHYKDAFNAGDSSNMFLPIIVGVIYLDKLNSEDSAKLYFEEANRMNN